MIYLLTRYRYGDRPLNPLISGTLRKNAKSCPNNVEVPGQPLLPTYQFRQRHTAPI